MPASWQAHLRKHFANASHPLRHTRFAPSPTGHLHLGHLLNAALVWGLADSLRADVLLRIEDHDGARCREEFVSSIQSDLAIWHFVPTRTSRQSSHTDRYQKALGQLITYPCRCTRKQWEALAPATMAEEKCYPGTCRHIVMEETDTCAQRWVMPAGTYLFNDGFLGPIEQNPMMQCGDMVLRDRHGYWSYQLAVVVDDVEDDIDFIVRGADIVESTGRQMALRQALYKASEPLYAHHPLIWEDTGKKLSKRDQSASLSGQLAAGATPAELLGLAFFRAGLLTEYRPLTREQLARLLEGREG